MTKDEIKARIKSLEQEERGFLSSSKTLREVYKQKGAPRYKEMASKALDEASKRRKRISELQKKLSSAEN